MGFKGGGLERFGQALEAGLFDGEGGRVAHGVLLTKENGVQSAAVGPEG
jgi:hypothetical protein